MIKNFEQFVLEYYNEPSGESINESFQSSKLREIIKQHGKPKNRWNLEILHDIKDNEVVDIVDSQKEYHEKYDKDKTTFMIELEDGACLVVGNLNIVRDYLDWEWDTNLNDLMRKRHGERQEKKGKVNLGKYDRDDIHRKHLDNVDKIKLKRFIESLQPHLDEIAEIVTKEMKSLYDNGDTEWDTEYEYSKSNEYETTFELNGDEYGLIIDYAYSCTEGYKHGGRYLHDIMYWLNSFTIFNNSIEDFDTTITNEELGITIKTYRDVFDTYKVNDVEGYIYDEYEYNGVRPEDFR